MSTSKWQKHRKHSKLKMADFLLGLGYGSKGEERKRKVKREKNKSYLTHTNLFLTDQQAIACIEQCRLSL